MAIKRTTTPTVDLAQEQLILEERKIKALEKIAVSLDALTLWFEDIDRDEWSDRIQFYLAKWLELQEQKSN
jgi:hypothetical protein